MPGPFQLLIFTCCSRRSNLLSRPSFSLSLGFRKRVGIGPG